MAGDTRKIVTALLRTLIGQGLDGPRREYRARAWLNFEAALERHLARKRSPLRLIETRR